MKKVSVEEVRSFVLAKLQTRLAANGLTPQAVPDDFDLFVEGIVDSMGLIELITAVEQNFEIRIDFEDLDPEDMSVIGPFCRYVELKRRVSGTRETMKSFRFVNGHSEPEKYISKALPLIHEAGNPYFDLVFGGREAALRTIASWMRRASSEISISRMSLLLVGDRSAGGFIALGGAELALCRKADTRAILKEADSQRRSDLIARMEAVRGLFPRVASDEFYLSKLAVAPDFRRKGLGRRMVSEYLSVGRAAGFRRFKLDLWTENGGALQLYESLGFKVVRESVSVELDVKYFSMVREQDNE